MNKANRPAFQLDVDLISLRALVAIVDAGSFSAAARRIGRTQSAVSLQIAKLEDRLQTRLLERTSRHVAPTAAGEMMTAYARRILATADEAAMAVSAPADAPPLRLGFAEYLAAQHLHDLLGRFRRAHPSLVFEVRLASGVELRPALERGELDIAVAGPDAAATPPRQGTVLRTEEMVWVSARDIPWHMEEPVPLVLMRPPCTFRRASLEALSDAAISWRVTTETNSIQAVQAAVRAGLGISTVARTSVTAGMVELGEPLPPLPETAMVAYDAANKHPLSDRLIAFLREGLA